MKGLVEGGREGVGRRVSGYVSVLVQFQHETTLHTPSTPPPPPRVYPNPSHLLLPFLVSGPPKFPKSRLKRRCMVWASVAAEPMQHVQRLQVRPVVELRHLRPKLAEDGVVEVVLPGDLVGYSDKTLNVLGLNAGVVGAGGFEEDCAG